MAYSTSQYTYKPGGSGTTVHFLCVSGVSSYSANPLAVMAVRFVLVVLVACAITRLDWRLRRKHG